MDTRIGVLLVNFLFIFNEELLKYPCKWAGGRLTYLFSNFELLSRRHSWLFTFSLLLTSDFEICSHRPHRSFWVYENLLFLLRMISLARTKSHPVTLHFHKDLYKKSHRKTLWCHTSSTLHRYQLGDASNAVIISHRNTLVLSPEFDVF